MSLLVDFKTGGTSGTFTTTLTLSVNFGSASDRAVFIRVFSYGDAGGAGGVAISSVVVDPSGANITLTGDAVITSTPADYMYQTGKVQDFALASASMPTGVKNVVVTLANNNSRPHAWVMTRSGVASVSASVKTWGLSSAPSATVSSASGNEVLGFCVTPILDDTWTVNPNAPAALIQRVISTDSYAMRGATWVESGAASVTIDGTLRNAGAAAGDVWGVLAWNIVSTGGGDTTPPVITGPGGATGGTASATIAAGSTAVHTYTANEAVTWSLNGGANVGLFTINGSSGALSYISPAVAGTHVVGVRATDTAGNATTQTLTVTVATIGTGPTINSQPAAQSVTAGATATFAVTASAIGGGTLSYQWRKDGASIGGATGASYTRSTVIGDNASQISVVVTETGGSAPGSTTSSNALLTVTAPGSAAATVGPLGIAGIRVRSGTVIYWSVFTGAPGAMTGSVQGTSVADASGLISITSGVAGRSFVIASTESPGLVNVNKPVFSQFVTFA